MRALEIIGKGRTTFLFVRGSVTMDLRKVFDSIPEEFDRWRTRYCDELFADLITYSKLDSGSSALEIGPGTGQATEPILKTGCTYLAIELGENLARYAEDRFSTYGNFRIVNADFETYDFGGRRFDLIYSAAAFQWIPEEIGYPKVHRILKNNGTFALMWTLTDEKSADERLYSRIRDVYAEYFRPEPGTEYKCDLKYRELTPPDEQRLRIKTFEQYGFVDAEYRHYDKKRMLTADGYVSWLSTHCGSIKLREPYRSKFFAGIRDAVLDFSNTITLYDTIVLYLAKKP
jgi:SAM-dependent methyltransferase